MVAIQTDRLDVAAIVRLIGDHPLFACLPADSLAELVRDSELIEIGPGQRLVSQGAESDAAYLVVTGEAEILVETGYGPVQVALLSDNMLVGDIGVFAGLPRTATVAARTTLTALRLGRARILALGRESPDILFYIINQLGARMTRVNQAIAVYTHALSALERHDFAPAILDELLRPVPELVDFAETFRRMAAQIIQRRARREEMANAAVIQRAMLPPPWCGEGALGCIELHAEMRPAREVGGDFYDYFMLDEQRLCLVIADVSGKGVPASLFLAITRTVIRLVARDQGDVAAGINRANELLCAENASSMFATVFYAVLDCATGMLSYCNCGHNPPLILRGDGRLEPLASLGLPLGMLVDAPYPQRSVTLAPGDRLLLYTDGVTEAEDASGACFGEARLAAAIANVARGAAPEIVAGVLARVAEFAAGAAQSDDQACLALVYGARSP